MSQHKYDVVVVGGGAAGLSAALVLSRAMRQVVVVDANEPRNASAGHMHGFLTREGISPMDLVSVGRQEVVNYGGQIMRGRVGSVETLKDGFGVQVVEGPEVIARRLIFATGITDMWPPIEGLEGRWGIDVLHCPHCHTWEFRDRQLAVIATSAASVHQALLVSQWTSDLTFVSHLYPNLSEDEAARLKARGIRIRSGKVAAIQQSGGSLVGLELADGLTVPCRAVFVTCEIRPNDALLRSLGALRTQTRLGSWPMVDSIGRTSVPGVWAVGNLADPGAQAIVSAADGVRAAMDVNIDLLEEDIRVARE